MSGVAPNRYPSPLRYPGGKGKVANYIKLVMLGNDLIGHDYVEPYAGGASVALGLLFEDYAEHVHINDLNPGVHAFWDATVRQTDELCELIERTPVTLTSWKEQRSLRNDPSSTPLQLGFATFYLNRANRSGIISGGVIGGYRQQGTWTIDARFNKPELIRRIKKVARYRSRITVTCMDALEFLATWQRREASPPAFLYLDPPYYLKGSDLYDNFYGHDDHRRVQSAVDGLRHPWVVSYDAAPEIMALYRGHRRIRYDLSYSAAGTNQGSELMFFSPGLHMPLDGNLKPSGIGAEGFRLAKARLTSGGA